MKRSKQTLIEGKVESFNISPKGAYEGVLLNVEDEGIVQVNFPREASAFVCERLKEGGKARLSVEEEEESDKGEADHPVYRLLGFAGKTEQRKNEAHQEVSVKGKVVRLNYALHGEINGAVLDNGDFIHLKPHGAKKVDLEIGQKLSIEGETQFSYVPHRIIEARKVNGTFLEGKKKGKK